MCNIFVGDERRGGAERRRGGGKKNITPTSRRSMPYSSAGGELGSLEFRKKRGAFAPRTNHLHLH